MMSDKIQISAFDIVEYTPLPKSTLKLMMESLHAMERVHDESPQITDEMIVEHFDAIKEIDQKVDNIDKFLSMCKANEDMYSERAEGIKNKAEYFKNARKKCENYMLYLIKNNPDIEYRGNDIQFELKLNPEALHCAFIETKSFSAAIHPDVVMDIPEHYREPRVIWQMKTADVKKSLKGPVTDVNFASLKQSEKLVTKMRLKGEK